eukprot:gene9756-11393_t
MGDAASALALLNQKFPGAEVVSGIKCERAIKWELTIGDDLTPNWNYSIVCVSIEKTPFAKGSCRTAHKLKDWSKPGLNLVGKFSSNSKTTRDSYFTDVLMQTFCSKWAEKFNELKPPKPITFLPSFVYELIDHPPPYPVCGGEPFIDGEYNHFSYENSNHELLIVDIQGVNDFYTDPQIHTKSGKGFGEGNLGETGFHKFLQSHKCNAVCDFLKLKQINQSKKTLLRGTLPVVQLMEFQDAINAAGTNQASKYDMAHFQSGASTPPVSLDDEEKQLQEQLERIRAQQKAKMAPVPKLPSQTNLHKFMPKPSPGVAKPNPVSSPTTSPPAAASPSPLSPKPVAQIAKPIPATPVVAATPVAQPVVAQPVAQPVAAAASPVVAQPSPVAAAPVQQPISIQVRSSPPPQAAQQAAPMQEIVPDKSAFEKWDLKNIRNVETVRGLQSECIVGDENRLYTGSNDGNLGVWDIKEMKHLSNVRAHGKSIRAVAIAPNKNGNLVTGGADSYIKEWDLSTMTVVKEIKEANEVNTLFIQDNLLFTGCNDKTVKVWDMRSYECVKTLQGHTRAIKSVCAMGNLLFSGSNDQQIFVWSLQNDRILTNFQGHEGWVKSLYAHNNTLYSGSHDETVKVWDLKTTRCIQTIKCKDRVETVHVTNQGIFAGSGDHLQVFDTKTHESLASINTRSSILCMWRKQNQIFTGSLASNIKVWAVDIL